MLLIGLTSYVPLYVQGVLGTSALVAGFVVAAMTLGWPISASIAGRFYLGSVSVTPRSSAPRRRRGRRHSCSP